MTQTVLTAVGYGIGLWIDPSGSLGASLGAALGPAMGSPLEHPPAGAEPREGSALLCQLLATHSASGGPPE